MAIAPTTLRSLLAGFSLALALTPGPASAADLSGLYSDEVLLERKSRYEPNIRWNFENLVLGSLTPFERARLGSVMLDLPLRGEGEYGQSPLAFYAGAGTITVPILSVKFFDDLTLAYAYLWAKGLSIEPVTDYVAMLKYRDPREIGGRFPPPLQALGVPADAWKHDATVDDVSQKALKSALVWIMAHELGHLYHAHQGYAGVTAEQAQSNEAEADRFANEIMRRIGVAPLGMAQFFMVMAHLDPIPANFPDEAAWRDYVSDEATHPLTSARMRALAEDLLEAPADFAATEEDPGAAAERVVYAAEQIARIGDFLDDSDIQRSIYAKALTTDPTSLKRWQANAPSADSGQPFDGAYAGIYVHHVPGEDSEQLDGAMELRRQGNRVSGRFWFGLGEGLISGIVQGDTLVYEWSWGTAYGRGRLVADRADGSLTGPWGYQDADSGGGGWQVAPE